MGQWEGEPATWGETARSIQKKFTIPAVVLFFLFCVILLGIGWSPLNVNVLRNIFVLADSRNEAVLRELVPPDGQTSPFIRLVLETRNLTLHSGEEEFEIREDNDANLGASANISAVPIDILRLLAVEHILQSNPESFRQWTLVLTFGISAWMFADEVAESICGTGVLGPNACAVLGPLFFLLAIFNLLLPLRQELYYAGISCLCEHA